MTGIVLIRSGSKSIKNKNIRKINGKPLVYWILNALQNSKVSKIILSTDSDKYIEIVNSFEMNKVEILKRSKLNSQDESSSEEALIEIINELELNEDIVFCQATSPLTTSLDINNAIELFKNYDSILSVVRQKRFLWNENGTPINYEYLSRPRRQDFEGYLVENGAIYISHSSRILKSKSRISGNVGLFEMNEVNYLELDEANDFIILENLLKKNNNA